MSEPNGPQTTAVKVTDKFAPWAIAVLAAIGWIWTQLNPRDDIRQVETRVMSELAGYQSREDARFVEFQSRQNDRLTTAEYHAFKEKIDDDLKRVEEWLRRISMTVEAKDEHNKDNLQMIERIANMRSELQDLQRQFAGTYNVGKQLDNLQAAVSDLQKQRSSQTKP